MSSKMSSTFSRPTDRRIMPGCPPAACSCSSVNWRCVALAGCSTHVRKMCIRDRYADVLGREIRVARSTQNSALGSAMFGAVAAGPARGGYGSIEQAAQEMGGAVESVYRPDGRNHEIYSLLYAEYKRLHDYFGRGADSPIKRLKQIRAQSAQPSSGA